MGTIGAYKSCLFWSTSMKLCTVIGPLTHAKQLPMWRVSLFHCRLPYFQLWDNFFRACTKQRWEAHWPNGQCARSRSERSGFEPWPGTLCFLLGQDTSQGLSPPMRFNGYWRIVGGTKKMRGSDLRWTSIPPSRSRNTPSLFMLKKPG